MRFLFARLRRDTGERHMSPDRAPLSGAKGFAVIIVTMFAMVGLIWALAAWAATQG